MSSTQTNVDEFLESLNAGNFKEKLGVILSAAALGTVLHGDKNKKGKVSIELNLNKVGENGQLIVTHKLSSSIPTKRGKKIEEDTTETPQFVGRGGKMTEEPPEESINGQVDVFHSPQLTA